MRVAVTGATGVIGGPALRALAAAGHDVLPLSRPPGDHAGLVRALEGCDAVCNLATAAPVGYRAVLARAWREHDWLRTEGVRRLVAAARAAGVRRLVQESVSCIYADQGDEWVTEQSPVEINRATEPASVGESHVQEYACHSRTGVVLRFGTIVGGAAPAPTQWWLRSTPTSWAHVVHSEDLGPAVVAALTAPGGIYNVGADPVRRADIARAYASTVVGVGSRDVSGPLLRMLGSSRMEPLTRSLRVSSGHLAAQTGWTPRRATFDASWFDAAATESRAVR